MVCSVMQVSVDGLLCCTISNDPFIKIYDVVNYDMMFMMRLPYVPGVVEWVYRQGDVKAKLAISDCNSAFVGIYDVREGSNEPIISKEVMQYFSLKALEETCSETILLEASDAIVLAQHFHQVDISFLLFADSYGAHKSYEVQSCE